MWTFGAQGLRIITVRTVEDQQSVRRHALFKTGENSCSFPVRNFHMVCPERLALSEFMWRTGQAFPIKNGQQGIFPGLRVSSSKRQRRQCHFTPVLLPGKSHGWRSLGGCSPWGREESDMTERLHFHFSLLFFGEGNGNPLQCSCLENPRDGVAQSQTRLK